MVPLQIVSLSTLCLFPSVVTSLLLSQLPTPSFIIDIQALQRISGPLANNESPSSSIPSIHLPKNGLVLRPSMIRNDSKLEDACVNHGSCADVTFPVIEGQPAIGYLHSSVTRAREDAVPGDDDPLSTFLAEIDLDPAFCSEELSSGDKLEFSPTMSAKLVLGLNNHHVGSYYWARSAGAGSSMEAPGVWFGRNNRNKSNGVLRWIDEGGPTKCNSNDGKRSEWVNFLREGDTVQLVPTDGQDALLQFSKRFMKNENDSKFTSFSSRIFGITFEGRPMGSEPMVVCDWRC